MAYTLHCDAGNFRAFKIMVAAEYNGVAINVADFKLGETNKSAEFLKISPLGKIPALSTPCGASLTESNAIARYIAKLRADTGLMGGCCLEQAQVDQWMEFTSNNVELPVTMWVYQTMGLLPANADNAARAKADLSKALAVVEAHLSSRTYLVGQRVTMADITLATTLVYPFKWVCDNAFRAAIPNTMRWFDTIVNQPQVEAVVGKVVLATSEAAAGSISASTLPAPPAAKGGKGEKKAWDGVKKEKAPKAPKPPAAPKEKEVKKPKEPEPSNDEEEPEEAPKEKKEDHIFKIMDATQPSPFVMDAWKRCYSNCESYEEAMNTFWTTFDAAGWSIWRGDYNYNDELKILFMTSNLIGGFIQRTDEIRKWLFGTMTIRGSEEEKQMKITAYFLIRGQDIQPLIACNDDAACYTWTKMEIPASEADKKQLFDYWTSDDMLDGEKCLDSRCYK